MNWDETFKSNQFDCMVAYLPRKCAVEGLNQVAVT